MISFILFPEKQSRVIPSGAMLPSTGDKENKTEHFLVGLKFLLIIYYVYICHVSC